MKMQRLTGDLGSSDSNWCGNSLWNCSVKLHSGRKDLKAEVAGSRGVRKSWWVRRNIPSPAKLQLAVFFLLHSYLPSSTVILQAALLNLSPLPPLAASRHGQPSGKMNYETRYREIKRIPTYQHQRTDVAKL